MRIEHAHTHAQGNRLAHHTLDQGRFASPCFADNVEVIAKILPPHAEWLLHDLSGMIDMAQPKLNVEWLLCHRCVRRSSAPEHMRRPRMMSCRLCTRSWRTTIRSVDKVADRVMLLHNRPAMVTD